MTKNKLFFKNQHMLKEHEPVCCDARMSRNTIIEQIQEQAKDNWLFCCNCDTEVQDEAEF